LANQNQAIRDFVFRGLLFETDSEVFRKAGIRVGSELGKTEESLLEQLLQPFSVQRRNEALQMSRLYALLHCFENEIRSLIRETLEEKLGASWWDSLPKKIKDHAQTRREGALTDSWLEGEKTDLLSFLEFGHLADVMVELWPNFEDIVPSQHWLKQRMYELEKARNFVAHNRMLLPSEFQRLYMYVSDWNKVIGL